MMVGLSLAVADNGALSIIGSVIRPGETFPCEQYGPVIRYILDASLSGTVIPTTETLRGQDARRVRRAWIAQVIRAVHTRCPASLVTATS
jgi:hypothetical protein